MHPMQEEHLTPHTGRQFVMGSFIKFVEMGGGVPIPITSDMTEDEMLHVLYRTNGLLIPGGVIPLTDEDDK